MPTLSLGGQTLATQTGSDAPVLGGVTLPSSLTYPTGHVLQTVHTVMTDRLTFAQTADVHRTPVTGLYADIRPTSTTTKMIVYCSIAMGFTGSPEWAWYADREASSSTADAWATNGVDVNTMPHPMGSDTTRKILGAHATQDGGRMYGYHGGPRDGNAANWDYEVESFYHVVDDIPGTTNVCRYQINLMNLWSGTTTVYVNRTGNNDNSGYMTRGSSSITVMEVMV